MVMGRPQIQDYPNVTSIRLPEGFKQALDLFLNTLHRDTGVYFSRSEFMVTATYWYLEHLLSCETSTVGEITRHLEQFSRDRKRQRSPHGPPQEAAPLESSDSPIEPVLSTEA